MKEIAISFFEMILLSILFTILWCTYEKVTGELIDSYFAIIIAICILGRFALKT